MIIEFYGCPGCGKTYAVRQIIGHDETIAMSSNCIKRNIICLLKSISKLTPESRRLKKELNMLIGTQNTRPLFIERSVEDFLNNIVLLAFGYNHIHRKTVMAEGIVHRIVSMAVNFGWDENTVVEILKCCTCVLKKTQPIYLDVDVDTCLESIKKRNRHETEMDELTDEKLKVYLERFKHTFDTITEQFGYRRITRSEYVMIKEFAI